MNTEKIKILIVDDRPENLWAMKVTLRPLEVEIFTAQSGNEALQLMLNHEFAVVLLDVQMPGMDGFETATLMQSHKTLQHTPIIFTTAINLDEQYVFKGYQSGAVDYLFKPINPDILLSKVKVFIKLYQSKIDYQQILLEVQKARNLESLGVLAGGIAHDFNNLLTAVFGNVELAKASSDPQGKAFRLLAKALMAAERAQLLTRQLLTFAKGGEPIMAVSSIADLIGDTCAFMLSGSRVKARLDLEERLWAIEVDRGQIGQVLQNLLLNAKDAMPEGGDITIRVENVELDPGTVLPLVAGRYVKVTVTDTGPGIEAGIINKIFDPYFTTKGMGTRKGQGLGLAICHSIIARHNGYIGVESEPGRGTSFHLYLPASAQEAAVPEIVGLKATAETAAPGRKGEILVMDDEETVIQIIGEMLQYLGYEAQFAKDGAEAVALFRAAVEAGRSFDLVILDLTIRSGMGGEETVAHLRRLAPEVRAVVASGYADDRIMADYRRYGFKAALEKPFSLETLTAAIQEALAG